jgi:hypothetical protein
MKKQGITKTVRTLCLDDIAQIISSTKEVYGNDSGFLILIDANESKDEANSQIPTFLRNH